MTLNVALKEWDALIAALIEGRQTILLRKGGILESNNQFELEHPRFLLFPTFVHQDPNMVKPAFRAGLRHERSEPEYITLRGYGSVRRIFEVPSRPALEQLDDLHMWDAPMLDMRFNYRPEKPLYLVVVQAFTLPAPVTIPNTLEYAGCRSWVPLRESIAIAPAQLALPPAALDAIERRIEQTFQP